MAITNNVQLIAEMTTLAKDAFKNALETPAPADLTTYTDLMAARFAAEFAPKLGAALLEYLNASNTVVTSSGSGKATFV